MKKYNHYTCEECNGVTIAFHESEGVTPFGIRCCAKDEYKDNTRVRGCEGTAFSNFFTGSQKEDQKPHVIFFRPEVSDAIEWINKQPEQERAGWLEHYQKGGSLMREVNPQT